MTLIREAVIQLTRKNISEDFWMTERFR